MPGPKPAASAARTNSSKRTVTRGASRCGRDSLVRGRARSRRGGGELGDDGGALADGALDGRGRSVDHEALPLVGAGVATRAGSLVNFTRMSRASRARSNSRPSCLRLASSADGCRSGCTSRARRRNASRISATLAPRVTPSTFRASSSVMRHPRGIADTPVPVVPPSRVRRLASRG